MDLLKSPNFGLEDGPEGRYFGSPPQGGFLWKVPEGTFGSDDDAKRRCPGT